MQWSKTACRGSYRTSSLLVKGPAAARMQRLCSPAPLLLHIRQDNHTHLANDGIGGSMLMQGTLAAMSVMLYRNENCCLREGMLAAYQIL